MNNHLHSIRHSCEHVLTQSMLKLYPSLKMAMGPATNDGFYFDFDPSAGSGQVPSTGKKQAHKISEADFPKIEKEMQKIIKADLPIKQEFVAIDKARKLFKGNEYKQEWLDEIALRQAQGEKEKVSIYKTGDEFTDLCSGPHVASTGKIGPFKLLSIAGAYWRGDEKKKMLTRIYGTCFATQKDLNHYLWQIEEAKKRDHRKLGRNLDLFVINEDIGKGLPLLTPKGTIVKQQILNFERQLEDEAGFEQVSTPHVARSEIYKKTGHWQHYRETMYAPFGIEGDEYVVKPMNCPHHYMIYASKPRSYKDLPIRFSEPGTCYRYEKSGELSGLLRVRSLTIDDAHILMTEEQVEKEFKLCINLVTKIFAAFKLRDYYVRLSLADPSDAIKYIANPKIWKKGGEILEKIVKDNKLKYVIVQGEASFYGPKIDYMVKDSLGREWQMSTLQLDLFMAKRLNLVYTDKKGKEKHPVILHRGLTGSLERTLAILIEHFAGAFPLWLSPIQAVILPISNKHLPFAQKIKEHLLEFRVAIDARNETMGAKVRDAALQKIPYMIIIGEREVQRSKIKDQNYKDIYISLRTREGKDLGQISLADFIYKLKNEIDKKI